MDKYSTNTDIHNVDIDDVSVNLCVYKDDGFITLTLKVGRNRHTLFVRETSDDAIQRLLAKLSDPQVEVVDDSSNAKVTR